MRIFTLLLLLVLTSHAGAKEKPKAPKEASPNGTAKGKESTPTTLEEAHQALEKLLDKDELAKIDAMKSEDEMMLYNRGLGMGMRNTWGLWRGGPLAKHMNTLGFMQAEEMSSVILFTFWCKRHGQEFRLKERAAEYAEHWEEVLKADKEEKKRVEEAKVKMRSMMMGLKLQNKDAVHVRIPDRSNTSLQARFLWPWQDGVFIAVRRHLEDGGDTVIQAFYFNRADREIHEIRVPEVTEVHSSVVAGSTAWFAGVTDGKAVLLGIEGEKRISGPLPLEGKLPQLGLRGKELLAVYANDIFVQKGDKWQHLVSSTEDLPWSDLPPAIHDDLLYLRHEGSFEEWFCWRSIKDGGNLVSLAKDMQVVGPDGPRWEDSFSYAVTKEGDLWACVGGGINRKSLIRRSKDGAYSIAVMNNSLEFTPDLFGSEETDQGISISAVTLGRDGIPLLAGNAGLYRLYGKELRQELAFSNPWRSWHPSSVIMLEDGSYFISGSSGGVYFLSQDADKKWMFQSLDEELGAPVTW